MIKYLSNLIYVIIITVPCLINQLFNYIYAHFNTLIKETNIHVYVKQFSQLLLCIIF